MSPSPKFTGQFSPHSSSSDGIPRHMVNPPVAPLPSFFLNSLHSQSTGLESFVVFWKVFWSIRTKDTFKVLLNRIYINKHYLSKLCSRTKNRVYLRRTRNRERSAARGWRRLHATPRSARVLGKWIEVLSSVFWSVWIFPILNFYSHFYFYPYFYSYSYSTLKITHS